MATLRAPDPSNDGPERPPEHLVSPMVESFVKPWEVESTEEAELLAESRWQEELHDYDTQNAHRSREIVVPVVNRDGFEDELTTTGNAAYSGLTVAESRALLLGLAPRFRDRRVFELAMMRGAP